MAVESASVDTMADASYLGLPTPVLIVLLVTVGVLALLLAAWFGLSKLFEARGEQLPGHPRKVSRVVPVGSHSLSAEELEVVRVRTGFTAEEVLRLHERFCRASGGAGRADPQEFLKHVPQLAGPLLPRLTSALTGQGPGRPPLRQRGWDFRAAATALNPFCDRAPAEHKTRLLFKLYDFDEDGFISKDDLRSMMDSILQRPQSCEPNKVKDEEAGAEKALGTGFLRLSSGLSLTGEQRSRLIERAVEAVFRELTGSHESQDKLSMEQFALVAGELASERCTVFF